MKEKFYCSIEMIGRYVQVHRRFLVWRIDISECKRYEEAAVDIISCWIRPGSIKDRISFDEDLLRDIRLVLFVPVRLRTWATLWILSSLPPSVFPGVPFTSALFLRHSVILYLPHHARLLCQPPHGKSQIRLCLPGTSNPGGYR